MCQLILNTFDAAAADDGLLGSFGRRSSMAEQISVASLVRVPTGSGVPTESQSVIAGLYLYCVNSPCRSYIRIKIIVRGTHCVVVAASFSYDDDDEDYYYYYYCTYVTQIQSHFSVGTSTFF